MASKPWADTPYPLIPTPSATRPLKTSHYSVVCATEMAHAHNTFIRALNSIYNSAPHVHNPTDIRDLLFYGTCWYGMVDHHHHAEEEVFFPAIEKIANKPGLMAKNVEQHEAFHPGFNAFRDYCRDTVPDAYDAKALRDIIDGFANILQEHLADEIDTLLALDIYDENELRKAYKVTEEKILATADKYTLFPMVMGCIDYDYEGGIHRGLFPPLPFFVPYLVKYWYERRYAGSWRFGPCDGFGNPRPLLYMR